MDPWSFPLDVPRGAGSLTIVAEYQDEVFLLHYDAPADRGNFHVETVPSEVSTSMMWPDAHGGVWLEADKSLWYRDAIGRWLEVPLPDGTLVAVANRAEPRELLVLLDDAKGEQHAYAAKGPATPAAATGTPAVAPPSTAPAAPPSTAPVGPIPE